MKAWILCLLAFCLSAGEQPGRKWTTLQRIEPAHLQAVHEARLRFARERVPVARQGVYEDFRAVLHLHAEDAPHTGGTRAEVLEAAKKTGVRIVMFTDHGGPKAGTWHGLRDGVLFLPGGEGDHELEFPGSPELRFLSHVEERPDAPAAGFDGMEIYNRHADAMDEPEFNQFFGAARKDPQQWRRLVAAYQAFPDEFFASQADYWPVLLEKFDREAQAHPFTAIAANDAHQNQKYEGTLFDPYEVAFRNVSTHILARELTEPDIRQSLHDGHAYVAHDWLCDPAGFSFVGVNNLGVFEMGDQIPLVGTTRLSAQAPVAARLKLIRNGVLIEEISDSHWIFPVKEPGVYRLEAWLAVDGEDRPWIYSNPIYVQRPSPEALRLPSTELSPGVEALRDISYTDGKPEDAAKHKLDIYRRKDSKNAPVLFFIHGGAWRSGDRALYAPLGNRFARAGVLTVAISYQLAPRNPHPAQIEDAAAAFAWVVRNIQKYGGDPNRIYLGGHSAGAHLAALLTLDQRYLKPHELSARNIRGVMALSGVYEIRGMEAVFGDDEQIRKEASPLSHVAPGAPPFLITYCQWDYATLPLQARRFHRALQSAGVSSELVFIPRQSHISEIVHVPSDGDPTAQAMLRFMAK